MVYDNYSKRIDCKQSTKLEILKELCSLEEEFKDFLKNMRIYIKSLKIRSKKGYALVKINFNKDISPLNKSFLLYWHSNKEISNPLEIPNFIYYPFKIDKKANVNLILVFSCRSVQDIKLWKENHFTILEKFFLGGRTNE